MILRIDDNFEHRHLADIIEMQELLYNKYKVRAFEHQIADAWKQWSDMNAAAWMMWDSDNWEDRTMLLSGLNMIQLRQDDDYPPPVDMDYDMENDLK